MARYSNKLQPLSVSICSEESINDTQLALERGGVWLTIEFDHSCALYYLTPDELIAWIEGTPIGEIASFPELDDARCHEAYKLFEAKLRKVIS